MGYPQPHRKSVKPKLPPSGPPTPPRNERVIPIVRRSVTSAEVQAEMIELAPPYLQAMLRTEVPRELRADASGVRQPNRPRTMTTSYLEQSAQKEPDEDYP